MIAALNTNAEEEILKEIIEWCNINQGFISAILTIMTIVISVIALRTSNKIGKMPYEKKIKAIPCYYHKDNKPVIGLLVVNYGMITLVVDHIIIRDKKGESVGCTHTIKPIVLKPEDSQEFIIELEDHNGLIEKHALDLNGKMTIEIHEFGNEVTKFKKGFPVG